MPSVWSKLFLPEWSLPYNCYEIGHTWTPSCEEAALDMTFTVFTEAIKLYTPLYIFSAIMKRKYDQNVLVSIISNILRSSSFLGFSALLMMTAFCNLRRFSGKFYYTMCAYLPVFVSSLFSILIEKRSRRGPLAVYCANIASETVYRMLVTRQYIKPIPRGEVYLFTTSMSLLLYMIRKYGYGHDVVSLGIKLLLGREESNNQNKLLKISEDENANSLKVSTNSSKKSSDLWSNSVHFISIINSYFPRHSSCTHQNNSCLMNTLSYMARNFLIGWSAQVLLSTFANSELLMKSPKTLIFKRLSDKRNIYFGLFLGSFTAIFKGINCILRRTSNGSKEWHTLIATLFAGPTMLLSPNTTITMYLLWKCIEMVYMLGVRNGLIGCVDQTIIFLYAISTAQLAYVTILEPNAMRPSYLKFVDRITGHRLNSFNRLVLDIFGTGASKGYEHSFPDLCLKYTTRQFQENIINWLL